MIRNHIVVYLFSANRYSRLLLPILIAGLLSGCNQEIPDEGLVPGIPWLVGTTIYMQLAPFGYEKAEYFIKGTANSYGSEEPLSEDGKWVVEPKDQADFRTRIVVHRPTDPAKFNGTVIVEWLNVSGGTEAASEWIMAHTELMRSGYAWIGVSAQKAGIDGGGANLLPFSLPLKALNKSRYGTLIHPGDKYAYDMFSQVGEAIVHPQKFNPLGELQAERVIAAGESQGADFLLTYVNAIAPHENIFDAFYLHSRLHGSAPFEPAFDDSYFEFDKRQSVHVRDDLDVPVLILQTETDSTILGAYQDSQPDTEMIRVWEVAGTAHADRYVGNVGLYDSGNNPNAAAVVENRFATVVSRCGKPVNSGPHHFVVKAAIAAIDSWLRTGVAPTTADRFEFDHETATLVRDQFGNVRGGIRTPYVDVPIATLSGEGQNANTLFCDIQGTTELFDQDTLAQLYPDHETYVSAVNASVEEAVAKGFLLQADGDLIKTWAQESDIGHY